MKNDKLYLAVTNDKYELPLYVCDTLKELSIWANRGYHLIAEYLCRRRFDRQNKCRYYRVNIEETEEQENE